MKRVALILLLAFTAGCSEFEDQEKMHYFDDAMLFENGCLKKDMMSGYAEDLPCLDPDNTGCVTREAWDAFMKVWKTRTPEPGIPLCQQMKAVKR